MSRLFFRSRVSRTRACGLVLLAAALGLGGRAVATQTPRFYPDDPIAREPESQDAGRAARYEIESLYEMTHNLFVTAGYTPSGTRARNLNTIDEVPDSSWFTNRIGSRRITTGEIASGPVAGDPPDPSHWVLLGKKTAGVHPGFRARDARGETWFIELDPSTNPEGATAAATIATKFFWALGYNQVESFLTTFDPTRASIDPKATVRRPSGAETPFTWDDLHAILERAARNQDGTYRIVAGREIPGHIIGNFQFAGTRPDDPNDLVPHEHRRELRALRVFGAWTNLTDLKAGNTLDTIVTENGRQGRQALPAGRRLDLRHVQRRPRVGSQLRVLLSGRHDAAALLLPGLRVESLADDPLRQVPFHRQVRGRSLRPARLASADADDGVHGDAGR